MNHGCHLDFLGGPASTVPPSFVFPGTPYWEPVPTAVRFRPSRTFDAAQSGTSGQRRGEVRDTSRRFGRDFTCSVKNNIIKIHKINEGCLVKGRIVHGAPSGVLLVPGLASRRSPDRVAADPADRVGHELKVPCLQIPQFGAVWDDVGEARRRPSWSARPCKDRSSAPRRPPTRTAAGRVADDRYELRQATCIESKYAAVGRS